MKITILNGNPFPENQHFEDYLKQVIRYLEDCWVTVLPSWICAR